MLVERHSLRLFQLVYRMTGNEQDAEDVVQETFLRAYKQLNRFESRAGFGTITTEIVEAGPFYYAEDYHQQYLEANPNGYCGLGGTGVSCPAPVTAASE